MSVEGSIRFLLDRFAAAKSKLAFVEADGGTATYGDLLDQIAEVAARLDAERVAPGASVQLLGDFGAASAAWLLALWQHGAIVAPVAPSSAEKQAEFAEVADAEWLVDTASGTLQRLSGTSSPALFARLRAEAAPGLIIFTSGTTGVSKGAVHDVRSLLSKFHGTGKDHVTLAFLLFDHIAGIDTLLYCLSNTSTLVCLPDRSVSTVLDRLATHRVEVLPTAPSFLNMLLLSRSPETLDLPSLRIITYGAEMMPQGLLDRVADAFPTARLIQKYGTSELGALRSQSAGARSRWIRFDSGAASWRVRDGLLEIRAATAMIGYLNAPSPFTEDGWYKTGDLVETDGDRLRFLGRDSDMINVGGQKVFPAEVEDAVLKIAGVAEVSVFGAPHPLLGAAVCARIRMEDPLCRASDVRTAIRNGLTGVIEPYKIPQKIEVATEPMATARFKQKRF